MTEDTHKGRKRHAVLRGAEPGPLLWVADTGDWQTMLDHHDQLACPEPGCAVKLFPRPRLTRGSTVDRHLWLGPGNHSGCTHWLVGNDHGGGPMTAQHLWLQARLLQHCRELGYPAIAEDPHTRADVYIPDPSYALEVQLRPTQFAARTKTRTAKGADTVWFIRHDLTGTPVNKAMWRIPSVRCKVLDRRQRWTRNQPEFQPWTDDTHALDQHAEIYVQSTVFRLDTTTNPPSLTHARLPAAQFLAEVLSGQRRWIPAGTPGMPLTNFGKPQPGWVRTADLEQTQQPRIRPPAPVPSPAPPPSAPPTPAQPIARKPETPEPDTDGLPTGCAFAALIGFVAVVALIIVLLAHYLG